MIEIDVEKILYNVRAVREKINPGVKLCAVLKGDGYGCGDVRFSQVLEKYSDVDMLAVATLSEAVHLRSSGTTLPILILCDTADEDAAMVIEHKLIPSVYRMEFARHLSNLAGDQPIDVHVRLDVCVGSPGMMPDQFLENLDELCGLPGIHLAGLYTQLYGAYVEDKTGFAAQLNAFDDVVHQLPQALRDGLCIHAASTTAACTCPRAHYNMVRIGAALYGLPYEEKDSPFLPVMSIKSRIISLKTVSGTAFTGYHDVEKYEGVRRLATVQGGYEDSLYLMFIQNGYMLVRGKRAPIVGEACMDTATIDVTDIPEAQLSDEVVLLGSQGEDEITIADIMQESGFTMANCQLVFKTGKRMPRHFVNYPADERWKELLHQVMQHSPTVRRAMDSAKNLTMQQYVEQLAQFPEQTPLCDPKQVNAVVEEQLRPVLGAEQAKKAAACFPGSALTANHHGVDCFAQSVQGNLMYRELLKLRGADSDCIPVISCSSVPMDNSSYGKGLLLFNTVDHSYPLRLPILPNKFNDSIVGLYPAMEEEMIRRALSSLDSDKFSARLSAPMQTAVRHVLNDFYLDAAVLGLESYSQQATAINYRITHEAVGSGFAYVDMEKAASRLLMEDLRDPKSLAYRILMEKSFRESILTRLDGATGCWGVQALKSGQLSLGGTAFFWAVDRKWTRAPMLAEEKGLKNLKSGEFIAWEEIPSALEAGKIYPALLLCFTALLFERGIRCYGGYFQPEYLRVMQSGIADALRDVGDSATAAVIDARDPSGYICGPLFLSGEWGEPVGSIEMLARKTTEKEIEMLLGTNFEQAHRPALANIYMDVIPAAERLADYRERLSMGKGK